MGIFKQLPMVLMRTVLTLNGDRELATLRGQDGVTPAGPLGSHSGHEDSDRTPHDGRTAEPHPSLLRP